MKVDVYTKAKIEIDIDSGEAFRILCKTLHMKCVLENEGQYYIVKNPDGENVVYHNDELYDERGDLFIALSNVAIQMFPNLGFRGADYIYNY